MAGPTEGGLSALRVIHGEAEFQAVVLEARLPVLVAFCADWCAPCAWLVPYLREIEQERQGQLLVVKVDVDRDPEMARRYRITSVPTVIHIGGGVEVERSLGIEPHRLHEMARR